jgi:hypothetical protein
MADEPRRFEDEAVLYLQGQLGAAERREFESRLEQSAELRAMVRELEEGLLALALAAPRREPPAKVWRQIEKSVTPERPGDVIAPSPWRFWLRNGWAAAATCLLGWMLYAFWVNRHPMDSSAHGSENIPVVKITSPAAGLPETAGMAPSPMTNVTRRPAGRPQPGDLARTGEIAALRRQVQELETQVAHLSRMSTQQQASASSRFTRFQMAPPNANAPAGPTAPPSPELQRALLLALARELGWLQAPEGGFGQGGSTGVDFVDLPAVPGGAHPDQPINPESATNMVAQSEELPATGTVPGFTFEGNTVFVIPPALVPGGSGPVTVWSGGEALGTFSVGENPVIVTISSSGANDLNMNLVVSHGTGAGALNPGSVLFQVTPTVPPR